MSQRYTPRSLGQPSKFLQITVSTTLTHQDRVTYAWLGPILGCCNLQCQDSYNPSLCIELEESRVFFEWLHVTRHR